MIEESETEKEIVESDSEGNDNTCKEIVFLLYVNSSKSYMLYYFDISSWKRKRENSKVFDEKF